MVADAPITSTTSPSLRYQPALDGIRAIAIVLVMLFHYPWAFPFGRANPLSGGFLGVDVFFVLSGFLITTLLLEEFANRGRLRLPAFYARRALRLLPAFGVLFLIAVAAHFALARSDGARPHSAGLVGMLFYLANWVQIWQRDSLGGVFGHTWSLAIEEQFYLLFPLLLVALLRLRMRGLALAAALAAGAATSAVWRAVSWRHTFRHNSFVDFFAAFTGRKSPLATDPLRAWDRWYFGTDTRADALLVGCVAAVLLVHYRARVGRRVTALLTVLAPIAMVVAAKIVWEAVIPDARWLPTWGLLLLEVSVAVAVVGIVAAPRAVLSRLLSLPPLVWIGRRSYAIYLFHPLVFHFVTRDRVALTPWLMLVLRFALVGVAAELSWHFVEQPFLRRKRRFDSREAPSPRPVTAG